LIFKLRLSRVWLASAFDPKRTLGRADDNYRAQQLLEIDRVHAAEPARLIIFRKSRQFIGKLSVAVRRSPTASDGTPSRMRRIHAAAQSEEDSNDTNIVRDRIDHCDEHCIGCRFTGQRAGSLPDQSDA
jgi:hypothetical protein